MIISEGKTYKIIPSTGCSALSDLITVMNSFSIKHEHLLFAEVSRNENEEREKRKKCEPYFQFKIYFTPAIQIHIDARNHEIFTTLAYLCFKLDDTTISKIIGNPNLHIIFNK